MARWPGQCTSRGGGQDVPNLLWKLCGNQPFGMQDGRNDNIKMIVWEIGCEDMNWNEVQWSPMVNIGVEGVTPSTDADHIHRRMVGYTSKMQRLSYRKRDGLKSRLLEYYFRYRNWEFSPCTFHQNHVQPDCQYL
jgi:hypothetical protein